MFPKFLGQFDVEREIAVAKLLKDVPRAGGSAKRETLENMVRTAFNAGILAGVGRSIDVAYSYRDAVGVQVANSIRLLLKDGSTCACDEVDCADCGPRIAKRAMSKQEVSG